MLIYLALGFVLLGIVLGGAGMRRLGRVARSAWRPGAGILALAAFVGAAVLVVRDAVAPAVGLFLLGIWLTLSVRRTARMRHTAPPSPQKAEVQAAADILGVGPGASDAKVQEAYRRLIRMAHPDQGGTSGLAAQLNAARDTMLRRRG